VLLAVAGEIRTPLKSVLGMTELLEETPLNPEQHKFLDIISNNGASAAQLD
jgi:signal transduction histidine kinase